VESAALVLHEVEGLGQRRRAFPDEVTTRRLRTMWTDLAARLWPHSAHPEPDGEMPVGGLRLSALAASCGAPAIILDETDVRYRCRTYRAALPDAEIAYAGKAFLCRAMARWIARTSSWRACTAISARSWDGAPREGRAPRTPIPQLRAG
jgi:hypothetical protein